MIELIQTYTPDYNYCILCGIECEGETCSLEHSGKLIKIRHHIGERKEEEKGGAKPGWNTVTIQKFNLLQNLIDS